MAKNSITKLLLLLLLILPCTGMQAQTGEPWIITENYSFQPSFSAPGCYGYTVNPFDGNWKSETEISYTHTIQHPSDPNIVANLRDDAWRVLTYEIYHDDGTPSNPDLRLVHTVTSDTQRWLTNGDFVLTVQDLANVPAGPTQIHLSVYYYQTVPNPFLTHLYVNNSGQEACATLFFGDPLSNDLTCDLGVVDCFTVEPCQATLNVTEEPCIGPGFGCYAYEASLFGASNDVTYAWTVTNEFGVVLFTGNQPRFEFNWPGIPNGSLAIELLVTDNIRECMYGYGTSLKTSGREVDTALESQSLALAPSLARNGRQVEVQYSLAEAGRVDLQVYDLSGRQMLQLLENEFRPSGEQSLKFVPQLAPGVYLLGLRTESGSLTKKFVVAE